MSGKTELESFDAWFAESEFLGGGIAVRKAAKAAWNRRATIQPTARPVAEVRRDKATKLACIDWNVDETLFPVGTKLYTAPVAVAQAGQDVLDVAQIIAIARDFIGLSQTDIGELIEFAHAVRKANNPLFAVAQAVACRDAIRALKSTPTEGQ